jgi:hypothetical protein
MRNLRYLFGSIPRQLLRHLTRAVASACLRRSPLVRGTTPRRRRRLRVTEAGGAGVVPEDRSIARRSFVRTDARLRTRALRDVCLPRPLPLPPRYRPVLHSGHTRSRRPATRRNREIGAINWRIGWHQRQVRAPSGGGPRRRRPLSFCAVGRRLPSPDAFIVSVANRVRRDTIKYSAENFATALSSADPADDRPGCLLPTRTARGARVWGAGGGGRWDPTAPANVERRRLRTSPNAVVCDVLVMALKSQRIDYELSDLGGNITLV